MPRSISLALVLHNHQPVGNFGWVFEEVYRHAYEPMLGALERHPTVRVGLHYTGPLLEWLRDAHPDFVERLRALISRDQVEILGGGLYEPILTALPERDRHAQLVRMRDEVERLLGRRPQGAWLAERVWEPSLPATLADAGYRWTILDDEHLRAASVREAGMWGAHTTDDQGRRLTVFGSEQGLRYRIPFREVAEVIDYLREHATEDGRRVGVMGDDGEKFGAWPETYESCWEPGRWVDRMFEALEANADWLHTTTPSAWLEREAPISRIYVPTSSYVEMTQWALPPDEANVFHDALERAREAGAPEAPWIRGGFWRNFQARYREINDLHKQMLRVSTKVEAMADGPDRERARDHLHRGQSNDCYWHGVFGGVYIVHMRMATLAELIAAEDLADAGRPGTLDAGLVRADLDLDGRDEVLLARPGQVVVVHPAEGGAVAAWDLRATRVALAAVMRRRPEAYHETLREHDRRREPGATVTAPGSDQPKTIHDIVRSKEPGLSRLLVYDGYERRSALVHLFPASTATVGPEGLAALGYEEAGDFVDTPWELEAASNDAVLLVRRGSLAAGGAPGTTPISIRKRVSVAGGRLDPVLEVGIEVRNDGAGRLEAELALEWGVNLSGGGGNPDAFYEWPAEDGEAVTASSTHDSPGDVAAVERLAFGNRYEGVRVDALPSPAARATWFPIETVSNSEAGFERIYQGSSLLFRWPLRLDAGGSAEYRVRFEVTQGRDRRDEERAAD